MGKFPALFPEIWEKEKKENNERKKRKKKFML